MRFNDHCFRHNMHRYIVALLVLSSIEEWRCIVALGYGFGTGPLECTVRVSSPFVYVCLSRGT